MCLKLPNSHVGWSALESRSVEARMEASAAGTKQPKAYRYSAFYL